MHSSGFQSTTWHSDTIKMFYDGNIIPGSWAKAEGGKKVNKSVTCSQLLSALHSNWSHPSGGFQKVYYKWITTFVPRSPNRLIYLPEKVKEIILLLFIRCLVFLGYKSQLSICSISSRATSKLSLKLYSAAISIKKQLYWVPPAEGHITKITTAVLRLVELFIQPLWEVTLGILGKLHCFWK